MMKNTISKRDLEDRLNDFAVLIIEISELLPGTRAGNHIAGQIVRSGTSPALNYGEAQDAESNQDFIHKIKIILKELRETFVALKIIKKAKLYKNEDKIKIALKENDELIAIFVATVKTARSRKK
ncbi:MAG: four helix bundle protein [Bacteroidetes bacterium]|nr:four helix bundle protein [Bacteroidota bacterium]MBL7105343.1 four helix bundle protein [Bacteroidales bacterium]